MNESESSADLARFHEHVLSCLKAGIPLDLGIPGPTRRAIRFLEALADAAPSTRRDDWPERYRRAIAVLDSGGESVEAMRVLEVPVYEQSLRRAANERWFGWSAMAILATTGFGFFVIRVVPRLAEMYGQGDLGSSRFIEVLGTIDKQFPVFIAVVAALILFVVVWRMRWFEPLWRSTTTSMGDSPLSLDARVIEAGSAKGEWSRASGGQTEASRGQTEASGGQTEASGGQTEASGGSEGHRQANQDDASELSQGVLVADLKPIRQTTWAEQLHAAKSAITRRRRLRMQVWAELLFTIFFSGGLVLLFGWAVFYAFATLLSDLSMVGTR